MGRKAVLKKYEKLMPGLACHYKYIGSPKIMLKRDVDEQGDV